MKITTVPPNQIIPTLTPAKPRPDIKARREFDSIKTQARLDSSSRRKNYYYCPSPRKNGVPRPAISPSARARFYCSRPDIKSGRISPRPSPFASLTSYTNNTNEAHSKSFTRTHDLNTERCLALPRTAETVAAIEGLDEVNFTGELPPAGSVLWRSISHDFGQLQQGVSGSRRHARTTLLYLSILTANNRCAKLFARECPKSTRASTGMLCRGYG